MFTVFEVRSINFAKVPIAGIPLVRIGCFLLFKVITLRCTVFRTRTRGTNGKVRGEELR